MALVEIERSLFPNVYGKMIPKRDDDRRSGDVNKL